ncbi:MAG: hypothetical protein ACXVI6_07510, partial [Candidatus Aminicenantales bacterium]
MSAAPTGVPGPCPPFERTKVTSNRFTTRREFFKRGAAVAAGLAVSPAADRLSGTENSAKSGTRVPFELGLASITFQEFNLDAVIALTRRVGLARISLKDFHLHLTSTEAEIVA